MNLPNRIKALCVKKGLTIARLEQDTGLANGSIRKWEKALPSSDRLEKIADYFNVSTDYLLARSTSCIIFDRLEELNMSVNELAAQTNVAPKFFEEIDWIIPNPYLYNFMENIAGVLDMPSATLKAALSRQEPPVYESDSSTYNDAVKDFSIPYDASTKYFEGANDGPATDDERTAVKAFLEAYRKMKKGE